VPKEVTAQFEPSLPLEGEALETLFAHCRKIIASSATMDSALLWLRGFPATPAGAFADLIASALNANVTLCGRRPPPPNRENSHPLARIAGRVLAMTRTPANQRRLNGEPDSSLDRA